MESFKEEAALSRWIPMNLWMKLIGKLYNHFVKKTLGLTQEMTKAMGEKSLLPGYAEMIRKAAAEGAVLLKNDGVLPFRKDEKIAVFGRCQIDWFYVGYGSGGDVHAPYLVSLADALFARGAVIDAEVYGKYYSWTQEKKNRADNGFWGHWPFSHPEMPLTETLVEDAARRSEAAIYVIGRAAGEDRENVLEPGSYYLTDAETAALDLITAHFEKTVVLLDTGSVIDMSWLARYGSRISAVLLLWLGGMESGNAAADLLYGDVCPSGRLPDTIAAHYEDYPSAASFGGKDYNDYTEGIEVGYRYFDRHPEKVLFPFGFGLSYTAFRTEALSLQNEAAGGTDPNHPAGPHGEIRVRITNTGSCAGKETAALFCHLPEGRLEKPLRVLVSFRKTALLEPGQSEELLLPFDEKSISSYDDTQHAFILEPGEYRFYAGNTPVGTLNVEKERDVEACQAFGRGTARTNPQPDALRNP